MDEIFQQAADIAACRDTTIIILHVIEENQQFDNQIKIAFGKELYEDIKIGQKSQAHKTLTGKNIVASKISQAISGFYEGVEKNKIALNNNVLIKRILVTQGRSIANEIINTSLAEDCSMIVMGCRKHGFLVEAMGDNLVKKVLKRSEVPVLVVPVTFLEDR